MTKGQAVKTLREVAGLTVRDTAKAAGISESYLSRVETGSVEASPEWIGTVAAAIAETIRVRALGVAQTGEKHLPVFGPAFPGGSTSEAVAS